jgi:hypothetical protein
MFTERVISQLISPWIGVPSPRNSAGKHESKREPASKAQLRALDFRRKATGGCQPVLAFSISTRVLQFVHPGCCIRASPTTN